MIMNLYLNENKGFFQQHFLGPKFFERFLRVLLIQEPLRPSFSFLNVTR